MITLKLLWLLNLVAFLWLGFKTVVYMTRRDDRWESRFYLALVSACFGGLLFAAMTMIWLKY